MSEHPGRDAHEVVHDATAEASVLEFARAVITGLNDAPRWLPCRYLYDGRGSELFDRISEQPEYYLTRTEASILAKCAGTIHDATGPVTLIELGSGSSVKTGHLLTAYTAGAQKLRYIPVDVSELALRAAADTIHRRHPTVDASGVIGPYETAFPLLREHSPSMMLFLGSTIGNFNRVESLDFWKAVSQHLAPGDFVLLGVDLIKDVAVLEAAYNDAAGVTAMFSKNLFRRINRELGAAVDIDQLEHVAQYNDDWQRIEISLRFLADQDVNIAPLGETVTIGAGEQVMTEISRKFELENMKDYLAAFGLATRRVFSDERQWFVELLLEREHP